MESKAEELRVLYVAMTRAKEKLILVGTDKISKTMQKKLAIAQNFSSRQFPGWYVSQASSYWEWIFMALARDQGEFEIYPTWSEEIFLWEAQRQIHYAEIVGEFLNLDSEKVYEKELYSSWKDWSNYLYPFASSTNMKGSFSVSELQNKNKAEIERLSHFSGSLAKNEANGVDYAKLGTAYHRLIKVIDPDRSVEVQEIEEIFNQLVREGEMERSLANHVNVFSISAFLKGDLGLRFRRAL